MDFCDYLPLLILFLVPIIIIPALVWAFLFPHKQYIIYGDCSGNGDCDDGQVCASGKCIMEECTTNSDCPTGKFCTNRLCTSSQCIRDNDCPGLQTCNMGKCGLPLCTQDSDCSLGRICSGGQCIFSPNPPSTTMSVISNDEPTLSTASIITRTRTADPFQTASGMSTASATSTASTMQTASPLPLCSTNADCPNPLSCVEGQCITCTANSHCDRPRICIPSFGCSFPNVHCGSDIDCAGALVCDAGRCILPPDASTIYTANWTGIPNKCNTAKDLPFREDNSWGTANW